MKILINEAGINTSLLQICICTLSPGYLKEYLKPQNRHSNCKYLRSKMVISKLLRPTDYFRIVTKTISASLCSHRILSFTSTTAFAACVQPLLKIFKYSKFTLKSYQTTTLI